MRRLWVWCAGLAIMMSWGGVASADVLRATRAQPLVEVSHEVDVHVADGIATYRVRRAFHHGGDKHEQAVLAIDLPYGAAATGLRIRGQDQQWHDGELMHAERARELYKELTGMGPHEPRDPALLEWRWADELVLQVFPIAPDKTSMVEYTLTAPVHYGEGIQMITYPRPMGASPLADPVLRITHEDPSASIQIEGRAVPSQVAIPTTRPDEGAHKLCAELFEEDEGSCAVSTLEVRAPVDGKSSLALSIQHTYPSDLRAWLRSPTGESHPLLRGDSAAQNDVEQTFELEGMFQDTPEGSWSLIISDQVAMDSGVLKAWSITPEGRAQYSATGLPEIIMDAPQGEDGGLIKITLSPGAHTSRGSYSRVLVDEELGFARLELDVARELSKLPEALELVFVVDGSRSLDPGHAELTLRVAESVASHVPGASVQVVIYDRAARALFGASVQGQDFSQELERALKAHPLVLRNGSRPEEGLKLAMRLLERAPVTHQKYVIVITDERMASTWTDLASAQAIQGSGVLLHGLRVSESSKDEPSLRRTSGILERVARLTGGIFATLSNVSTDTRSKELDRQTLGLVRPVQLDAVALHPEHLAQQWRLPGVLHEGSGVREFDQLADPPERVTLTGELWSRPVEWVFASSQRQERATAAFIFSHNLHSALTEAQQYAVAMFGRAVSPVTSYLAIEPGVRPSHVGLEAALGGSGLGGRSIVSHGMVGLGRRTLTHMAQPVIPVVYACARQHLTRAATLEFGFETTKLELLALTLATPAPETAFRECVEQGIWGLELTWEVMEGIHQRFAFMVQVEPVATARAAKSLHCDWPSAKYAQELELASEHVCEQVGFDVRYKVARELFVPW